MKRKLLVLLLFIFSALGIYLFLEWAQDIGEPPKDPPLPNPNAYELLIELAEQIDEQKLDYIEREFLVFDDEILEHIEEKTSLAVRSKWLQSKETQEYLKLLKGLVQANEPLLKKLPNILVHDSRIPVIYQNNTIFIDRLYDARRLQRLLEKFSFYHITNSDYDKAGDSLIFILKISEKMIYGGMMVDRLVTHAIYHIGCGELWKIFIKLDLKKMKEIVQMMEGHLEKFSDQSEYKKIIKRDQYFEAKNVSIIDKVKFKIAGRPSQEDLDNMENHNLMETSLYLLEFAKLAYLKEHGTHIKDLNDLVPKYLKSIPKDPFGDGPFKMKILKDGSTRIYSVGPDGKHHNGSCECDEDKRYFCIKESCDYFLRKPQPIFEIRDFKK